MGIISLINSKKGKLYIKFIIAVAIYAYSAVASTPVTSPAIVNNNGTTVNGVQIANASVAQYRRRCFHA